MKVVLIDDEVNCTEVLNLLLKKHCKNVEILATFNDSSLAFDYLQSNPVDLVFLDIEMPVLNGFDLLKQLGGIHFKVIFTTAYDQYAIKAFKFNTIDYLLKPIDKNELTDAVIKYERMDALTKEKIDFVAHVQSKKIPDKILLPIGNELIFLKTTDIVCCEADGSYCLIHTINNEKPYLLSRVLREIEELLNNPHFFRPHASWLINDHYITKIVKGDAMEIVLNNTKHIPVARSRRQEVLERLLI